MSLDQWEQFRVQDHPVSTNVERTPMRRVASDASVAAAFARNCSEQTSEIVIWRYDEKDQPTPLNSDRYTVWKDLPSHHSYKQMVSAASTEDNENLRQALRENVYIVKEAPGEDHWMAKLPTSARSMTVT